MPRPPANREEPFTVWHGLLLAECSAVLIGLLMPITSSRFGSGGGIVGYLFPDPGYLLQALVYFVLTNLIFALIALVSWLWLRAPGD